MCFACHVEGAGLPGYSRFCHPGKYRPHITAETLERFWMEDTSDGDPIDAAAAYFRCKPRTVHRVREKIKV